uniref:Uncharacterized protein n=1 Tax=Cynoglossus semilaevis TaxID=244447 RepID=A0A3P8UYA5_CYNSE
LKGAHSLRGLLTVGSPRSRRKEEAERGRRRTAYRATGGWGGIVARAWQSVDKGVRVKEGGKDREVEGKEIRDLATVGLSPRHCQPDNGNGRKRREWEKVSPCTSPVNVTNGSGTKLDSHKSQGKWRQF